ncbi:MAG: CapA family protein [Ardenticatenaceae bacterium]|nr:CapA family protein [Ardenticatenaceae bacterium]
MRRLRRFLVLLPALLLFGCQPAGAAVELAPTTAVPTPQPITEPTNQPINEPTIQPTNQPTPTVVATNTPHPPITLSVPLEWIDAAETAVANLPITHWQWQITPTNQQTNELTNLTILPGDSGTIIYQEPLALTVPFITNWEATTLAQAQDILANGHTVVQVKPWNELTPDWKALRIDGSYPTDPDYPLQNSWSLVAEAGYEAAAAELAPYLQDALREKQVHVTAVGDLMLARDLGVIIERGRLAYPFAEVAPLLQAADLTIGNLESALGTVGQPAEKSYPFEAPPAAAEALALAGFDIVTLANNHAMDYGPEALLEGLGLLHAQNVATIGAGADADATYQPYFTEVNGLRLAFLGYVNVPVEGSTNFDVQTWTATADAPGLAWGTPERILADVTAVAPQADLTIVVLHSGLEYIEEPSEIQMAAAHAAIDGGADLVIGHHTHILQGIEFYNDGVIVYGLGNFAFDIDGPPATAVLNVWLNGNGVHQLELIPASIQETGQPRLATPEEAAPILERVHFLTMLLNASKN